MFKSDQISHGGTLGGTVAVLALLGVVTIVNASCDDDDGTQSNGGSGGTAGRGGSAGRAGSGGVGGGSGGSTAGTGGNSGTGAAGTGGATGGTGGSSAGTGGASDAGVDAATGDGGPTALTEQQMAEAICASYDLLTECEPSATCVDDFVTNFGTLKSTNPGACDAEVDAYFTCWAYEPIESFTCVDDAPNFGSPNGCGDQEAAMFACLFPM